MSRPARRRSKGFTIIELMIVLVVMSIMVMTVAPSLSELLADQRQVSAAYDIVRFARRARAKAVSTGYAQLLRIMTRDDADGANGHGRIELHAGMNNKCAQTPWAATFSPTGGNLGPSEIFSMLDYNPVSNPASAHQTDSNRPVIWLEVRVNTEFGTPHSAGAQICYQPNGEIYRATTSNPTTNLVPQPNALLLTVARKADGQSRGVARQVLFPVGGNARLR